MRPSTILFAVALALVPVGDANNAVAAPSAAVASATISGVVRDQSGTRLANTTIVLECTCLQEVRTTQTNANGLYAFRDLPAGEYTIRFFSGETKVSKVITLTRGQKMRVNTKLDPTQAVTREIRVKANPKQQKSAVGRTISMEEFRNVPVGNSASRDFTAVVESSASASTDAAGISLGGTSSGQRFHRRAPVRAVHFGRGRRPALRQREPGNREAYAKHAEADFVSVRDQPLSTFSVDVDTASYSNVRRFLSSGQLPPPDAVRIEELVNYFDYDYVQPTGKKPMTVNWELSECPWNRSHVLARVGLQTKEIRAREVPPRNLVFLLDVSGSMSSPDKLPLLQRGMLMLVDQLREQDTVSIVVYAGAAGLVLPTTHGHDKATIRDAISMLSAGGSTNGGQGIQLAYAQARKAFIKGGVNRVILATDGDFNVGMSSNGDMERLIVRERKSHVFLSVLGFGTGNLQDTKMELLADKGNGNYAYIDSEKEAKKVLVAEAGATLVAAAKDVKLQIELNPAKVASYRLIGYDNRRLANEDFANDKKDAGEMGAGHSVTALYEIVPAGEGRGKRRTARLKYQGERARTRAGATNEWMTVKVRYKRPTGVRSRLLEVPMGGKPKPLAKASRDFRFAAAVAEFGLVLHESDHAPSASLGHAVTVARGALGPDPHGHRAEFLELAKTASRID